MKKYPRIIKIIGTFFLGVTLFTINQQSVFAAGSLSLTPSSGVIDADGSVLTLVFNSNGEEVAGASVKISFTGQVEYVSSNSTACTQSFDVMEGTGAVIVSCLFTEVKTYSGSLASLVFKSNASSSTSVFILSEQDPATASVSGGTYTLVNTSSGSTDLPSTAVSDSPIVLLVGFILILCGVGIFMYSRRRERILLENEAYEYEEFINSPKMKDKLNG